MAYYLEKISQTKGHQEILKQIDLKIEENEVFAILGPSGGGKTTLLNILAQIDQPTSGRFYGDNDAQPKGILVFQDYRLFPHMTVVQNITFGLKMRHIPKKARLARAAEIMKTMGISDLAKRYPDELSGGQQQRVALARALILKPKLVLMDEPFSSLDEGLRLEMLNFVKQLQQQFQLTIIFVTHYKNEAYLLSNQVAILIDGTVMQLDEPAHLEQAPANLAVAEFLGQANFIPGTWIDKTIKTAIYQGPVTWHTAKKPVTPTLYIPFAQFLQLTVSDYPAFKAQVLDHRWIGNLERVTLQVGTTVLSVNLPPNAVTTGESYDFYFKQLPVVY
ncbi:ABC transporter ATP-binding protein [Agrilactobacillus yilanensis]|uniref:ABC transporter ATP-binding protein n=1 Tax=Agrilactobacillus yilanensis TaxID=2485997 RepID=A0ABW4J9Z3_9LACO|nr:ABC transporter ATP-binding protein [Agrilactobacillus yilanensis]